MEGECCHSNSNYPNSGQRISVQTVEDWERADEILQDENLSDENLSEDGPLEKAIEAGAIFAVPKKVEIARERKVQTNDRCIILRE